MNSENLRFVTTLPILSESRLRLQELLSSFEGDFFELTELFESDITLAAMLLKFANSPRYNFSGRRVVSVGECVKRFGCTTLEKMFSTCISESAHVTDNQSDIYQLWQRSFVLKSLTNTLLERSSLSFAHKECVVIASLFQDLGCLVKAHHSPELWNNATTHLKQNGSDLTSFEEVDTLTYSHGELAASILEQWKISSDITIPIRYHEHPDRAPRAYRKEAHILNCSSSLLSYVLPSLYGKCLTLTQIETVLHQNGVSPTLLNELVTIVHDASDRSRTMLSLWGMGNHLSKLRTTGSTSLLRPV